VKIQLFDIYNLILQNINKEVLHKDLEEKIRKAAALQALDDFIKADKELIGSKYYELQKKEQINNDKFFSENMKYNFESNYQKTFEHYNLVITDKLVQDVKNRILNP
jgi:ribonucleotide reductase alpha subunit